MLSRSCFWLIFSFILDVGNKAATFPLQLLGFEVDTIHSVQFSNHTGYENGFTGDRLDGTQLLNLIQGLERNHLLDPIGHLLTGYIGSASFLQAILDVVHTLRNRPDGSMFRYVCDPVLGDKGVLYVPQELVALYRNMVIPVADVVTPNQFEAELLTNRTILSLEDARAACRDLHALGPHLVLLTSVELTEGELIVLASTTTKVDGVVEQWLVTCPVLPSHFTGTGDLCAALWLAHTTSTTSIPAALEKVVNTMWAVLEHTSKYVGETAQSRELRLVSAKKWIENPPERFHAEALI